LSKRPERRFWGWGYVRDGIADGELRKVHALLAWLGGGGPALPEPVAADFDFAPPRVKPPAALAAFLSDSRYTG
jgi:alkyldihydroxyacetonephosphate synthase